MRILRSVKVVGVAALAALSFAGNAGAVTVSATGPNGNTIVVTGVGDGSGTWYKVPAVPEADTWAMMALGLGLVGLRLRSRKGGKTTVA
jgi:hypothetical protein